jgi:hypothetical protein
LALGSQTLTQTVTVKPDPRDDFTQDQYESGYAFARKYSTIYGKIDEVLNNLDAIKKSLARVAASAKNEASVASQVAAAQQSWSAVFGAFTADYKNDEDSIQRSGSLRESIPRTGFGGPQLPPTAEQLDYAKRFDTAYTAALAQYNDYVGLLSPLQTALKNAGIKPLDGATTVSP